MIEDKFGAELLGLQRPVSELPGRLPPSGLQKQHALAPTLSSSTVGRLGVGLAGQTPSGAGPGRAGFNGPAAVQGGAPSAQGRTVLAPPSAHTSPLSLTSQWPR